MNKCVDHLNFCGGKCPDCGADVDLYGNTEDQFENCCFPDCGCDGSRLVLAQGEVASFAPETWLRLVTTIYLAGARKRLIVTGAGDDFLAGRRIV